MPSWKKVITSGSDASLNSLTVINGITGSLFGTSSYATSASYAISSSQASTASFVNSTSNVFIQNGNSFGTTATLGTNDNNSLALETNGTTRMFISSSGDVGIGTTSPGYKLDVYGSPRFYGDGNHIYTRIFSGASNKDSKILIGNDAERFNIGLAASSNTFSINSSNGGAPTSINIDYTTGNVGIGTTNPATPLHVAGGPTGTGGWNKTATLSATYPGLIFNSNATKWGGMAYDHTEAMRFWVNAGSDDIFAGTLAMSILNGGNVGIGVTNPTYKLDVNGNTNITGTLTVTNGITGSLFGTSSFATTASFVNTLNQNLTFNGNLTLNGTASISYLNVQYESASVIFSSGSNIFGDAANDTQTLIGTVLVSGSQQITGSLNVSQGITGSLFGTASFATTAASSSYPIKASGSSLMSYDSGPGSSTSNSNFLGANAGANATNAEYSNFLGVNAGASASNAASSNFLGASAGVSATNANNSNFIGGGAGYQATSASNSNFLGESAGQGATDAAFSNFLGRNAGKSATFADNSNFLGSGSGQNATSADNSNFLGQNAGYQATNAEYSNFLGSGAGQGAPEAFNSNFLGQSAGKNATSASDSNFIGYQAGQSATKANNSNFFGSNTGEDATKANNSNFLGNSAGKSATSASNSNFLGSNAGENAINAENSNFLGNSAGKSATFASSSNFLGSDAGANATSASNSNFLGDNAGDNATNASYSNFIGNSAGQSATNANASNFFGTNTGEDATKANNSNFLGDSAGQSATSASYSNFFGNGAGKSAIKANNSNFLGDSAGESATSSSYSNFLGANAGKSATNSNHSNFLGRNTGQSATNAEYSNFLGRNAGRSATSASYSTLLGYQAGYNVAGGALGIKSNNIIIGTNITLPDGAKDSINLGGIIFATGSYSTTGGNPFSGSMANGKVGIGTTSPLYPLHVGIDVSGTSIYASADIVAYSDESVKENIRPIENVIERIQQSRGVLYDRIDIESKNNIGFIAQELEVAFPELVVTNEDGTKAVKYQNTVAVLFEAIKEQQKQINSILKLLDK